MFSGGAAGWGLCVGKCWCLLSSCLTYRINLLSTQVASQNCRIGRDRFAKPKVHTVKLGYNGLSWTGHAAAFSALVGPGSDFVARPD